MLFAVKCEAKSVLGTDWNQISNSILAQDGMSTTDYKAIHLPFLLTTMRMQGFINKNISIRSGHPLL